jgi:hypothetical protein
LPHYGADGWQPVLSLADARRSDIVAWKSDLLEPGGNTGHVFVVVADPEIFDDGVISILSYDSSNIRHYDDTRGQGSYFPLPAWEPGGFISVPATPAGNSSSVAATAITNARLQSGGSSH